MQGLSDQLLLEAYEKAEQLNLDEAFIKLLEEEMEQRNFNDTND